MLTGLILIIVTIVSMLWANSHAHELYEQFLHLPLLGMSLQHVVNDGLMVIFFYFVGLEIKKELLFGELSSRTKAALPIAAALGGMIVPALIYAYFNHDSPAHRGWGIPMATDIAFAVGILSLLGNKVPTSLKVFLLALAIVDDLGAILVIAFFYTENIMMIALGLATVGLLLIWWLQRMKVKPSWIYISLGVLVWFAIFKSGVHATIAGVLLGFVTGKNKKGLEDLLHRLEPAVNYAIMPIFALTNAGVRIEGVNGAELWTNTVFLGVLLGLVVGKPLGVLGFSFIATKLRWAQLPRGSNWMQIGAVGCLAGIGFTMALFIGNLALGGSAYEIDAKLGILVASFIASAIGLIWLKLLRDV